jgi:hypothetical protein
MTSLIKNTEVNNKSIFWIPSIGIYFTAKYDALVTTQGIFEYIDENEYHNSLF